MAAVIVPARAGVLSAVGLLTSPIQRDLVRSWPTPLDHTSLADARRRLAVEAAKLIGRDAETTTAVDCRYAGQSHELTVGSVAAFHEAHRQRNGFSRPDAPVEVVAVRATASLPSAFELTDLPAPSRSPARGPAAIAESDCTIWLADGWTAEPGAAGALVLRRQP
jgi:N-methylhydantoinase A/oxoprolinase/acetone carboxylase beta subunit